MQFGKPALFGFFGVIPLLIFFYCLAFRMRRRALETFAGKLSRQLLVGASPFQRALRASLIVLSVSFLILALADPKWGYEAQEVTRKGIDMVIAVDTSKSMLTQDIRPNRLARAKLEIESLIDALGGDRVALVTFAGGSFIQCPLTLDDATVKLFLEDITVGSIPVGGTDIGNAIQKSLEAFKGSGEGKRVILLITDGEDHGAGLSSALREAKKEDVTIYPIGIGHSEGAPIPVSDEGGEIRYLRGRDGAVVISKLDVSLLDRIASETGGRRGIIGGGDFSLEGLYQNDISKFEKRELGSEQKKEFKHRFQWPLAAAIFLLTVEGVLGERR